MAVKSLDEIRVFWKDQVFAVHFLPLVGNSCWPGIGYHYSVINDLVEVSLHKQVVFVEA